MIIFFKDGGELECGEVCFGDSSLIVDDIYNYDFDEVETIEGNISLECNNGEILYGYTFDIYGSDVIVDEYRTIPISDIGCLVDDYDGSYDDYDDVDFEESINESCRGEKCRGKECDDEGCHGKKKKKKVLNQKKVCHEEWWDEEEWNKKPEDNKKNAGKHELKPKWDRAKSFYKKAYVVDDGDGELKLYSYNTHVATIIDGIVEKADIHNWSRTTDRHIRDFLSQYATAETPEDLSKIMQKGK